MHRHHKRIIAFISVVLGVFVAIPLVQHLQDALAEDEPMPRTPVRVEEPAVGTVADSIHYPGTLEASRNTAVVPRVAGEVQETFVSEGDHVEAGDKLFRIDDERVQLEMEQARANWRAAESSFRQAQRGGRDEEVESAEAELETAEEDLRTAEEDLERMRRLHEAGTIPRTELESAESEFRSARTQLENARRNLRMLQEGAADEELEAAEAQAEAAAKQYELAVLQLNYTQVTAPVSGRVSRLEVEPGDMAGTGDMAALIVGDDAIKVRIAVPERFYERVSAAEGQLTAQVRPVAYPNADPFPATVIRVDSDIDPATRTFEVELAVDNEDGLLSPGMYVNSDLVVEEREGALTVPADAVVQRGGRHIVFVVEDEENEIVREVEVERGLQSDGMVEIRSGLPADAPVVVEGNAFLEDGQEVEVAERS